jgi:hypothetical protein
LAALESLREAGMKARKPKRCQICKKRSLSTEEEAREHLAGLLRRRTPFRKPGAYAVKPYLCPEGNGWHVGRDPDTLMINFKKGRTRNVGKLKEGKAATA